MRELSLADKTAPDARESRADSFAAQLHARVACTAAARCCCCWLLVANGRIEDARESERPTGRTDIISSSSLASGTQST